MNSMAGVKVVLVFLAIALGVTFGVSQVDKKAKPDLVRREKKQRAQKVITTDDGRVLIWASGPHDPDRGEWFDMTDAPLDSNGFQYGIGKDTIASIDQPRFVSADDQERLAEYRIDDSSQVIGYVQEGPNGEVAKAYPIQLLDHHELVNDVVAGHHVTVAW